MSEGNSRAGSRLFYAGTRVEVQLGDQVLIRKWLGRNVGGVVCYIPGQCPIHPDLEVPDEGVTDWAIRLDNGRIRSVIYAPEEVQPGRHIGFVRRGEAVTLNPDERLA